VGGAIGRVGGMTPRWRLAAGWLTLFVVGTDLFIISPLLPSIAEAFGLSVASTGLSVTVFSLTYLVSAPLFGHLADWIGRRRTLIGCLAGFAAANVLTGLAPNFGWLLAARVAAGAAASGVSPLIYAGVGESAPAARRATWMAIAVSGLLLALSVGAPIGTIVAARLGWRAPFCHLAQHSLPLIAANRLVWPSEPRRGDARAVALPPLDLAMVTMRLLPTVLWATALYGVYTYLGAWLTGAGLSSYQVARAIGFYGVGALAGTLVGGHAADRFGTREIMLTSLAGLAVCLTGLGVGVDTGWTVDIVLLVTSIFAQFFFPSQQAGLTRDFPQRRALILALNNSALFLGISIGSVIGGEAMAWAGFSATAAIGVVIACGALILVATRDRPRSVIEVPKNVA
jgi:predicted MFS family arabinose efflux permease